MGIKQEVYKIITKKKKKEEDFATVMKTQILSKIAKQKVFLIKNLK